MSYNLLSGDGIIESGGGRWTPEKGPYGVQSERTDIFGQSRPLTEQTFGNMYGMGPSYLESHTPHTMGPVQLPYEFQGRSDLEKSQYAVGIGSHKKEGFNLPANFGSIPEIAAPLMGGDGAFPAGYAQPSVPPTTPVEDIQYEEIPAPKKELPAWLLLILVILLFITITYWIKTSDFVMNKYVFKELRPTIYQLLLIASLLSIGFLIIVYLIKRYM